MENLERILSDHPFFHGVNKGFVELAAGCAKNARFEAGDFIFHEGEAADQFYLVREGRVALQVAAPGRGAATFLTLGAGEVFGVNWLVPPYRWVYDAKALERCRLIAMDAKCLRGKCEADHSLGYDIMKRLMPVLIDRLHETRLQFLDLYGSHG
ncbi:cyclic nucleotide-binding domain-containing protein [Methylocystis sp. MJC1]|jgi:CRP-like cAMP-binding protein|uniref:cyclic nucleotide-binding domain-containing protein n=1 Tax=Methylocystis sp. MJC1 TaxID=2654282 RepID=UPI0013EB8C50|nr:cyclic nucleotide-binding domain-containing protein [Methylocystis sp. MJC1]KAF2991003.1 CRP-like cAMP-activated global transcriptional regulator [Methylocystis sp. MJC1]MBU6526077.1 cyclic nucleotide-binding domain-containing protein [Methylocystis sp. MJC1]UZX12539.1 cyclic nucleotide-binding domain-containing protein [Methylocystis sp. MJC1]